MLASDWSVYIMTAPASDLLSGSCRHSVQSLVRGSKHSTSVIVILQKQLQHYYYFCFYSHSIIESFKYIHLNRKWRILKCRKTESGAALYVEVIEVS